MIGDARIYAFPGANGNGDGNGPGDINKLLLSTSGLALINSLLEDGKLGDVIGQVSQLIRGQGTAAAANVAPDPAPAAPRPLQVVDDEPTPQDP